MKLLSKEFLGPIIIVVFSFVFWLILKRIINRLFRFKSKKIDEKKKNTIKSIINNTTKAFIIIIDVLLIMEIFGIDTKSLVASLGVVGLVVGLALQDLLKDLISGIIIIFENQFCIGDVVTINGFKGEVVFLSMKSTRIKSFNGEVKILSNRMITEVINHTIENSLAIVDIGVSYNENLDKVEQILNETCLNLTKKLKNIKNEVKCVGIQNFGDSAITYRVIVETKPMEQYEIERIIRKELKQALDKNNIEIPFQQVVVHNA